MEPVGPEVPITHHLKDYFEGPLFDDPLPPRGVSPARLAEMERQMHHGSTGVPNLENPMGLDRWSRNHADEEPGVGLLSYRPGIYRDQRLERTVHKATRLAIFLPETSYVKSLRYVYAKAVGSTAVADAIVETYHNTIALPGRSDQTLTDYAIECFEDGTSFGVSTEHADRLSDVADFTVGYKLAVAQIAGKKYHHNFKMLVNKNASRETYRLPGKLPIKLTMPFLISLGVDGYYALPPGESFDECDIPEEVLSYTSALVSEQYRKDKKKGAVALGFVMTGSRSKKIVNEQTKQLERLEFKDCYTGSFAANCNGGIVPANRWGKKFEIGSIFETRRDGKTKKRAELVDELTHVQAEQVNRLAGVPVGYVARSGANAGKQVIVDQAA